MIFLPRGRFAPSPTGRMHLGNLWAAFMSWLSVKSKDGKWILRIEDLDSGRSRIEWSKWIEDDLTWLGLQWDEGGLLNIGSNAPYCQSKRGELYHSTLLELAETGMVYPCSCTRAEIMATQAPHQSDGRIVYDGKCRPNFPNKNLEINSPANLRMYVPNIDISFCDEIAGVQKINLAKSCGDFILKRKDGAWAYQLAVVADDADMGITEVVRGNDLLLSAAQQIYLYRLLNLTPPSYGHLPLICNQSGQRLSKRDSALACDSLREKYHPHELIGLFSYYAGFNPSKATLSANDALYIADVFGLENIFLHLKSTPNIIL